MQTASEARFQILKLKHLPPLSPTAARLLELLTDEDLSLTQLSRVIGQDPLIAARILGVANSAYFGQTIPVHSVEDAVIRVLGLNMVKSLAFSIAISGTFDTSACEGFDLEAYWYRSLATAACSRQLCLSMPSKIGPDADGLYLAGLLFDIGSLVLVHLFPQDYARVLLKLRESDVQDLSSLEEALVGINSHDAGAWLTDRWHLPQMVVQVVGQAPVQGSVLEVALVGLAAKWVRNGFDRMQDSDEAASEQAELLGMDREQLRRIQGECMHRDEEIRSIASMLVN